MNVLGDLLAEVGGIFVLCMKNWNQILVEHRLCVFSAIFEDTRAFFVFLFYRYTVNMFLLRQ